MIQAPLFPCQLVGRDIIAPSGLIIATVHVLIHPTHAAKLVEMLNTQAASELTPRISFKSKIPLGAWIYCEAFGWLVNRSEVITPEIRIRQGFTHYSVATEKPAQPPAI